MRPILADENDFILAGHGLWRAHRLLGRREVPVTVLDRAARRASVSQTNARFQQATGAAASIIMKLMVDPKVPDSVRLRASEFVVNHAAKAIEIEDIEARVAALETATAGGEQRR